MDNLTKTVNFFVDILEHEHNSVDKKSIDSKLLYIYLEMPKAKQNDMKKLVPFIYKEQPNVVKEALYRHFKID